MAVSQLANAKGCNLRILRSDNESIYWIENRYFIGRPYNCLEELVQFIQHLPLALEDNFAIAPSDS